jgi:uncharacterized RDD family membrane protein YckC
MLLNILTSLVDSGLSTVLLTVLILIVLSFVMFTYIKVLYKPTAFGYPSTMKRLFAFLYDMIIINLAALIILLIYTLSTGTLLEYVKEYATHLNNVKDGSTYYLGVNTIKADFKTIQFYLVIVFSILSFILEIFGKRTIGKNVMGIKVGDGKTKPALWQSFVRNLIKIPVIAMWPVFLFISLIDKKRRWVHDLLSKSVLVSTVEN